MADIELVIKISEELYESYKGRPPMLGDAGMDMIAQSIANGTLLPKRHGRLIDADYLKDVILLHNFHGNNKNIVPYEDRKGYRLRDREVEEAVINAPTIIGADKEK